MFGIMKENLEDLLTPNLWLALPSEFLGTLVITLFGCGACITTNSEESVLRISLTFGLAVATVVLVFQHISGAHINPAVTTAALFTRRVSIIRGILYIISQIIGGIVGAGILYGVTPDWSNTIGGSNALARGLTSAQGFGIELLITFVYVLTVFACQDEKRSDLKGSAPLTIGLAAVVGHLFAFPYTRAGMNPARSFGPAITASNWENHWVFWTGPVAGGLLAGLLYEYVFAAGATFDGVKKCLLRTKRPRKQPDTEQEPEKTPLEELKNDVIEIEDTKVDVEKPQDVAEPEPEKGAAEVVEVNEQEKK